ncbi:hypothetical protein [Mycolicibacterium litorale]|nr:hypothetical protein [Mycolicibacterium litorale]
MRRVDDEGVRRTQERREFVDRCGAADDVVGERANLARMLFLDGHTCELCVDWHRKARAVVGNLRHVAGRHPDDPLLAGLIGELSMKSW